MFCFAYIVQPELGLETNGPKCVSSIPRRVDGGLLALPFCGQRLPAYYTLCATDRRESDQDKRVQLDDH